MTKNNTKLTLDHIQAFYKSRLFRSRLFIILLILVAILVIVRVSLSHAIIFGTTSWLKQQEINSSIESININFLDGTVSLVNATGSKDAEPLFNVGLIDIHWHWAPLSEKTIVITKVVLDHLTINIEKYSNEIVVGGVRVPLNTPAKESTVEEPEEEDIKPWAASLGEVVFTELNICYLQHESPREHINEGTRYADYCVDLEKMIWGGTISYATDAELLKTDDIAISSTGNFSLNGLTVSDNKISRNLLVSSSNKLTEVTIKGLNDIRVNSLKMSGLSALQRDDDKHKDAVRFSQLIINDIKLKDLNTLTINDINVKEPGFYLVKDDDQRWEYEQWIPQTSIEKTEVENNTQTTTDAAPSKFNLSINNILVEKIDSCYLQRDTDLYYCLLFDELDWDGSIKFDTAASANTSISVIGDLGLTDLGINNMSIDRNMLKLSSISLIKIKLDDFDSVTLDSLQLAGLTALQRSNDINDNTLSFDELAITEIKHTQNNLEINSINLSGLASTTSINEDGSWEHDKWMPAQHSKAADKTGTDTENNKPVYTIALDKIDVSTDKNILFTDNTTQPAMKAGLQKLGFSIENLYSSKPDSVSPFKLHAKTTRHSTIDISGKITPFADKISLDADGKLKGFDLRAASPTAKKAIGHIIQSGQLDADLDLKAVDGVLDSNIALSLYHFQIKPESKEDAEKLDKRFGMPLNQTLVLLRNKDDSIHLDIPITGDVNNPEFDPMDAIIKATSKAATVTLITFYTPYGLIYAGGNLAFDLATALNFDPIQFSPGSSEILADSQQQLDDLSKLLIEKPQVHLTLCGVTNQQDTFMLYPEYKTEKKNKEEENKDVAIVLSKEQVLKLNQLAKDRQLNSKNYLIEKHNIEHNRLILCAPEHKTGDDDISGVEINI